MEIIKVSDAFAQLSAAELQFGESEGAIRTYLHQLSDRLAATCARADICCSGKNIVFDQYSQDEWTFGHLYCNYRGLYLAASDSTEAMSLQPGEEQTYSLTAIRDCPIAWVRAISKRETIEAFLGQVQETILGRNDELRNQIVGLAAIVLPADQAASGEFQQVAQSLGFERVAPNWQAAQMKVFIDPETAVRSACVLVEEVCKHILDAKHAAYDHGSTLPQLVDTVREALGLETKNAKNNPLGKVSSGLTTVLHNIGVLRNTTGDAHGRRLNYQAATRAQARFAVNAAGTIAMYLMEQWKLFKEASVC